MGIVQFKMEKYNNYKYKKAAKKQYGGPVVMVVDNATCHSNTEEVFSEEEFLGCEVIRLGPIQSNV